jgi:hypothetical protein
MNNEQNKIDNLNEKFANIKRMLNNTETIGKTTLVELNNQGEQLKNLNNKSNILYDQLKITKSKLQKIVSTMSITHLLFNNTENKPSKFQLNDISSLKLQINDLNNMSKQIVENNTANNCHMNDISIQLKKIKGIAIDMNNEIKNQSIYMDNLSTNMLNLNKIADNNSNHLNKVSNKFQ